jgi:CBS domain-containing protein
MPIHDPLLSHIRVSAVMHTGILTTDASVPLQVVARLMSEQRVHAVAVADPGQGHRPFGFVTMAAIVRAADCR